MKQKYYWITGAIILLAIVGVIFTSLPLQRDIRKPEPQMAMAPMVNLEATVISLSPDTNIECQNKCPGYQYPKDTGVIKIDKIISVKNPSNVSFEKYKKGEEIDVNFIYSSRPAKLKYVPESTSGKNLSPQTGVTHTPTFSKPIPKENGYFIYTIETPRVNEPTELILPELEVGSKIHANVSYASPNRGSIGKYKIIS